MVVRVLLRTRDELQQVADDNPLAGVATNPSRFLVIFLDEPPDPGRVRANDPALLRHLEELGLVPGTPVEALEYSPFDQNLSLRVGRDSISSYVIGLAISSRIFVEIQL